jgi:hypothetical protein
MVRAVAKAASAHGSAIGRASRSVLVRRNRYFFSAFGGRAGPSTGGNDLI